jgi:CubicO group peptidase (beta-lactamase class C family)
MGANDKAKSMKRLTRRIGRTSILALVIVASGLTVFSAPVLARTKRALAAKPAAQVRIEHSVTALMDEFKVPGVSMVLIHGGKITWQRGFGVAKTGAGPVNPDTLFQAASISKTITAFACMRLVEAGKLKLDEDVNLSLRSWHIPPSDLSRNHAVTLRELLSHTAGINVDGFDGYVPGTQVPTLLQVLDGTPPSNSEAIRIENAPGEKYEYSGGGYTIVQQLLIDQTQTAFPPLMKRLALEPLQMHDSAYDQPLSQQLQARAAFPHDIDGKPLVGGAHIYPELAAAGLWTTAPDLARFAIAMQSALKGKPGSFLSATGANLMVAPVKDHSAMGIRQYGDQQSTYFIHTGSNEGYKSVLLFFPDGNGVVIMTNSDNGYKFSKALLPKIAAEYKWANSNPIEMLQNR